MITIRLKDSLSAYEDFLPDRVLSRKGEDIEVLMVVLEPEGRKRYLIHNPSGAIMQRENEAVLYVSPNYNEQLHRNSKYRWMYPREIMVEPNLSSTMSNKEAKVFLEKE